MKQNRSELNSLQMQSVSIVVNYFCLTCIPLQLLANVMLRWEIHQTQ